jgi:hypothetical protein
LRDLVGVALGAVGLAQAGGFEVAEAFARAYVGDEDVEVACKCVVASAWCVRTGGVAVGEGVWRRALELARDPRSSSEATMLLERWRSLPDEAVGEVVALLEFGLVVPELRVSLLPLLKALSVDVRFVEWLPEAVSLLSSRWDELSFEERRVVVEVACESLRSSLGEDALRSGAWASLVEEGLSLGCLRERLPKWCVESFMTSNVESLPGEVGDAGEEAGGCGGCD